MRNSRQIFKCEQTNLRKTTVSASKALRTSITSQRLCLIIPAWFLEDCNLSLVNNFQNFNSSFTTNPEIPNVKQASREDSVDLLKDNKIIHCTQ